MTKVRTPKKKTITKKQILPFRNFILEHFLQLIAFPQYFQLYSSTIFVTTDYQRRLLRLFVFFLFFCRPKIVTSFVKYFFYEYFCFFFFLWFFVRLMKFCGGNAYKIEGIEFVKKKKYMAIVWSKIICESLQR